MKVYDLTRLKLTTIKHMGAIKIINVAECFSWAIAYSCMNFPANDFYQDCEEAR